MFVENNIFFSQYGWMKAYNRVSDKKKSKINNCDFYSMRELSFNYHQLLVIIFPETLALTEYIMLIKTYIP